MITEALVIGLKEGFKIGIVWLVLGSYLALNDKKYLLRPFYFGFSLALLLSLAALFLDRGAIGKEVLGNSVATSLALFLLASVVALFHASGTALFGNTGTFFRTDEGAAIARALVFIATMVFFLPDGAGSVLFLRDLSVMKGAVLLTSVTALTGFMLIAAIFLCIDKFARPAWIGRFFDLPQLLLFLSMVKLLGGGTRGLAELSLIPSVQRGLMKFAHDVIHQTFIVLMVPDHPLLKATVWNFIGIFFGPNIAAFAALFLLLLFPLAFVYHSLVKPLPERDALTGSKRRKRRYLLLSDRRRKALPVIFFIGLILFAWFSESGESISRLYDPVPKPVVADRGTVLIPLHDPTMDLMDGILHKFSLSNEGETIRILVIRKANSALSVCLDACEICQPKGYGQREDHVVCIYCGTPIPVDTLGQPGGCNPIPLSFAVDERFIRIEINELSKKWEQVKTGKGREAVK